MIQAPNLSETNESTAHVHHVLAAEQTVLSCHFRDECRITPAGWDDLGVTEAGKELHDSMIQLRMEESPGEGMESNDPQSQSSGNSTGRQMEPKKNVCRHRGIIN